MRPLARLVQRKEFVQPNWWDIPSTSTAWWPIDPTKEDIGVDFASHVHSAYRSNGVVFACILARLLVFSEARFQFRSYENGRPGELFGSPELRILERPWPNGTTGELLARMEQDVSLAGNCYLTVVGEGSSRRIRRLRPDFVTVVTGSPSDDPFDLNAEIVGYMYEPRGTRGLTSTGRAEAVLLTADQVAHYSPIPDPDAQWRGMSWITPVIQEISGDKAAMEHKAKFFKNGAVPGLAVSYDASKTAEQVRQYAEVFNQRFGGVDNAYRTVHMGGGADPKPIGADMKQIDFKVVQGHGETRIAAAAGVHPVIVGLSEGMQGSSLNAGNFQAARRRFADGTIRPLWRSAAAALENLVELPPGDTTHLWYDARDVPFLREDAKEEADTRQKDALTIKALVEAGFEPESAVRAVNSGDLTVLQHSGRLSVQLQDPTADLDREPTPKEIAEMIQKIYLGVGVVLSAEEARAIVNRAGADLNGSFQPPVLPPT